ncbi:MAG: hypothetical protein JEZ14_13150 [Marinilabiliaceae bacterium]|nr:hypothetical protein [Marinilabiliaceae bacterium]
MKKNFIILVLCLIWGSCEKEKVCDSELRKYPSDVTGYQYGDKNETFDFELKYDDKGRIIKRIGGVYSDISNGYLMQILTKDVYDSIIYKGNTIKIFNCYREHWNSKSHIRTIKETTITVDDNGLITKKNSNNGSEVIEYDYNDLGLLVKTFKTIYINGYNDWKYQRLFTYSSLNNLKSVESVSSDINGKFPSDTIISVFSDYDNAPNPFKKLRIFDDALIRSLSSNNFKKYDDMEWIFNYDDCGNVKFY